MRLSFRTSRLSTKQGIRERLRRLFARNRNGTSLMTHLNELFLAEGKLELDSDSEKNFIWKTVLRTGQWNLTPEGTGSDKPLRVVRDGISDPANNIVSLSELVQAFQDEAFEHVTVPLAQNMFEGDHADIARNNTGFIRDLKIVEEDGVSKLKAAFDFTEPDIKERVERGTIPNTSVGILYDFVRKSDAKKFPVALAHVALTHRPWIDKMEPFGVAASDGETTEVLSFEPVATEGQKLEWKDGDSFKNIMSKIESAIHGDSFKLNENFEVVDVAPGLVKIWNKAAGIEWVAGYTINNDGVAQLPPVYEWDWEATKEESAPVETAAEETEAPEAQVEASTEGETTEETEAPAAPSLDPVNNLQDASLLREQEFAQGDNSENNGGLKMSDRTQVNGLNLSDLPENVRVVVEALAEDNQKLRAKTREEEVEGKVKEWGELGLSALPGFLKTARQIMLSDDGNVAALMLSDDGKKEKVTATEIVERLVDSLPKTEEGKVELSAQLDLGNGDHEKPAEDNVVAFEDRLAEARSALGKPAAEAN